MGIVGSYSQDTFSPAYKAARQDRSARVAETREQRKRRRDRKRREMPEGLSPEEQRAWRLKQQQRIEDARHFVENAQFESQLVQERLREGFVLRYPRKVGPRWREDVREKGLRSAEFGLPGKMFVAACRKGGDLRTSWDKATLGVESRSKLLSLDLPYVELNRDFLIAHRIDLDRSWDSVEDFRWDIRELVGWKLPHAPHLVTGDEHPDGSFHRPHLYFFLPPGQAVWNAPDDPRCNKGTVDFFKGVTYGIVDALRDLGADPNAPVLTMRGKNPLSPLWTSFVMEDREFLSLQEWSGWVDTRLSRDTLVRRMTAEQAGLELPASNRFLNTVQKSAYRTLARWHFDADPRARLTEGSLADALHQELEPLAQDMAEGMADRTGRRMSERQVALMVARVSGYAAAWFDPDKLQRKAARGALLHAVDGLRTVRERQQVAAEYASREKAERTLERLAEAWDSLAVETTEITKSALAREAKVSRTTVQSRWSDLQALLVARQGRPVRCIDKKPPVLPAHPAEQESTGQDVAQTAMPRVARPAAPAVRKQLPTVTTVAQPGRPQGRPLAAEIRLPDLPSPRIRAASPTLGWEPEDDGDESLAQQEAFLASLEDGFDPPGMCWADEGPPEPH